MIRVFTTGQVAKIFSVNINTVIKWFDEGKLKGFRLPRSNERRIYRESVTDFMAAHDISLELLRIFDEEYSNRKRGRGNAGSSAARAAAAKKAAELRNFPRKPVDLMGKIDSGAVHAKVSVKNLSMGGVYLTGFTNTDKLIPEEFRLTVETTEGSMLEGTCQLVHMKRSADQSMTFGCRFTQVDPGSLMSYLATI